MKTLLLSVLLLISLSSSFKYDRYTDGVNIDESPLESTPIQGDSSIQFDILERMEKLKIPGVSIALVVDRKIKWAEGYGIANSISGQKVTVNTLFQAGSISKPLAALGALILIEQERIALDDDVNTHLKEWKIPENNYTKNEKVTLRRLLTHSAGVTVHGFPGYRQKHTLPSIEAILNGKGNTGAIYINAIPGDAWRYSGGGYTIIEKLVEEISDLPFDRYMAVNILKPLRMENSTFEQPLPLNLHGKASAAYNRSGKIIKGLWHNYPEQAAAGLWTTPSDLAKYCIEIQEILIDKSLGILSKETIEKMLTKHKNDWGLGLHLVSNGDSLIFEHGGKNAGFTNSMTAWAYRGNALIIMTNGDNGGELIKEIKKSVFDYYKW